MAKHRRVWNANVYEKYVREGRGSGSGAGYLPWIRVQDFSSQGVSSRVNGMTTGRVHHLMSNNELAYFYILDWSEDVTDIREQYPLSDVSLACELAAQAGIRYPVDKVSGYPYVLTCDFMVTTPDGLRARTVKMTSELHNERTLEKLEIERRFWLRQGIDWKIVTEREIAYQKAKNIEWLYTSRDFDAMNEFSQARDMLRLLLLQGKYSVVEAAWMIESEYKLSAGTGLQVFKQLVINRVLKVNLDEPLNLNVKGALDAA